MRLRNILIVVEDIEKSKKFYHDLFGLDVILDNEKNVILCDNTMEVRCDLREDQRSDRGRRKKRHECAAAG